MIKMDIHRKKQIAVWLDVNPRLLLNKAKQNRWSPIKTSKRRHNFAHLL